jgi:hypothetical protein
MYCQCPSAPIVLWTVLCSLEQLLKERLLRDLTG